MNSNLNKKSGILLHPTALPGNYGIGEIGPEAYNFIDHLVDIITVIALFFALAVASD